MQIEVERQQDHLVRLLLAGSINEQGAEVLKSHLDSITPDNTRTVELDCNQVDHFGSSGIGKLLVFYKRFTGGGGEMSVINLPSPIHDMFLELKLDTLFSVNQS